MEDIIRKLVFELESSLGKRRFDGGVSLYLHGMDYKPRDLDIRADKEFCDWFEEKYVDKFVKKGFDESKEMHYSNYNFDGVDVEIAWYNDQSERDKFDQIVCLELEGLKCPVLSLENMSWFYQQINSPKVDLISKFLKKN